MVISPDAGGSGADRIFWVTADSEGDPITSSAITPGTFETTPGGTFEVGPAHSRLGFAVRHMMTPVHGQFPSLPAGLSLRELT